MYEAFMGMNKYMQGKGRVKAEKAHIEHFRRSEARFQNQGCGAPRSYRGVRQGRKTT